MIVHAVLIRSGLRVLGTLIGHLLGSTAGRAILYLIMMARESECCSFFGFTVTPVGDELHVEVPAGHVAVLNALAVRAAAAPGAAA